MRGDELWKIPRNNMLYVAGVHDKSAILVGRDNVTAYTLADGKEAWSAKSLSLADYGLPSGRGFQNGPVCFVNEKRGLRGITDARNISVVVC